MPIAIIRTETGRLVTIARDDVPQGWAPPDDCHVIDAAELSPTIEREQLTLDVPELVTPRQLRLWLVSAGISLAAVESQLETEEARIEWEYATEIRRDHPLVAQLGDALELTSAQVDEAFRAASQL